MTTYENILAALTTYAPADRVEALVRDLDAMRASAREEVLDEVGLYLRAESARYLNADEHHERAEALHLAAEEVASDRFRNPPADPEQARLEREVAQAAVAYEHARAAAKRAPFAEGFAHQEAYATRDKAGTALVEYILTKREGGAK